MIEFLANYVFRKTGRTWKIGGSSKIPGEEDIVAVLDKAAETLFDQDQLTVLTVGGLKIEKNERGRFDVYVHIGEYI